MEWSVPLIFSLEVGLEGGSGVLASCERVAPSVDFERGRELLAGISTSIYHRLV